MKLSAWSILVITLVVCIGSAQAWTGFSSVVSRLTDFQAQGGGFKGTGGKATAEATNNALLLASLYGLKNKVNVTEASKFITSLENSDGGYGPTPGSPSDAESTRNALQSLQHLGGKAAHPDKVSKYIKSLLDSSNNLFAVRSGEKGSVKGTAFALQSLDALGELSQGWVKEALPKIKIVLSKHKPADAFYFSFPEDKETSQVTANYYGIIVGNYVGYEFTAPAKWAKHVTDLQSTTGQFYDTLEKKATSLASTAHAMLSLSALGKGAEKFVDSVNVDNLKKGVRHIAADISSAAHAHSAVALTNAFKSFFKTVVNYDGADNEYITEGSSFSPSVAVHSIFEDNTAHPHGGFDVETSTTFHGQQAQKGKLNWDDTLQRYTGVKLATLGNLGPVKFVANLAHKVAGLGNLAFDIDLDKNVGYGLTVVPKVSLEGGADIKEGQAVAQGTDFKFTVSLNTFSNNNLLSGDFVVTFNVLDSSLATVYQTTLEGTNNKAPIVFVYKLSANDIPAGTLTFRFDVAGKGAPHTTRSLKYNYLVPLVASHISMGSNKSFKLGEKVKVTMEPAAFPDLRNTHALATKDATGNDVTDKRKFLLDIRSPQGTLIRSVSSTPAKGSTKYTFDFTVEPTLDSIGTNVLSFRYVPAVGEEVVLQNFDSATGELFEDNNLLSYIVKSALSLVDITDSPKAGKLFYGGNVGYKFRLKDDESGQYVYPAEKPLGNVFLDLSHEDASGSGRPYSSLRHPATTFGEGNNKRFHIDWNVNPNAVNGDGSLGLHVVDVDGNPLTVKGHKAVKVNIGGNIDVTPDVYTTSIQTSAYTALVAEFTLACQGKQLKDADLLANIVRDGRTVATLPVAYSSNGRYSVSLTGTHKDIPSANYKFEFYRVADRRRAQERREMKLKRERKERELRGETAVTAEDEGFGVEPLFTVNVPYSAPRITSLPLRAEFLSVVLLGGLLGYLVVKKNSLNKAIAK